MTAFLDAFLDPSQSRIALFRSGKKWILCRKPIHIFSQNGQNESFWDGRAIVGDAIDFLEKKMEKGFCVGFFSFDFGKKKLSSSPIPRAEFVFFQEKIETDNPDFASCISDFRVGKWASSFPKSVWQHGFSEIQRHIRAGEIYQANLTRLFSAAFSGNVRSLFCFLNAHFEAPRAAFFGGGDFEICSMSPEIFLDFSEQKMCTKPIKGTAKRENDFQKDRENLEQLLYSEKERAELLMITDLLRNDLSESALAGSTKVEKLRALQKNANVFHTFSEISAERKPEISPLRALARMLPGGSVSGCPKIRALEILDELEPHERGIFCGIFGFFDGNTRGESSVLIRTFVRTGSTIFFQAGGGITTDSNDEAESDEIDAKARVFFDLSHQTLF